MVNPSSFVKALELAKPPYPNMFIEFNETALFKAYRKFYSKHFADLVPFIDQRAKFLSKKYDNHENKHKGYHIFEHRKGDDTTHVYTPWTQFTSKFSEYKEYYGKWSVPPLCFRISNVSDNILNFKRRHDEIKDCLESGSDIYPQTVKYRYNNKQIDGSDQITLPGVSYFGEDYFHYYNQRFAKGVDQRLKDHPNKTYGQIDLRGRGWSKSLCHKVVSQGDFASIISKIDVVDSYAYDWINYREFLEDKKFKRRVQEQDSIDVTYDVVKGQARFLVAALSMFNFDHVIYKKRNRETTKIEHIVKGKRVPFNEYSLMTIELPKPRGVKRYEREFSGHGSPKCEHWRCGHWRRFRDRLGNVTRRVWIKAQKLGNKELGTKITDYKLDKAQGQ